MVVKNRPPCSWYHLLKYLQGLHSASAPSPRNNYHFPTICYDKLRLSHRLPFIAASQRHSTHMHSAVSTLLLLLCGRCRFFVQLQWKHVTEYWEAQSSGSNVSSDQKHVLGRKETLLQRSVWKLMCFLNYGMTRSHSVLEQKLSSEYLICTSLDQSPFPSERTSHHKKSFLVLVFIKCPHLSEKFLPRCICAVIFIAPALTSIKSSY